MQILKSYQIKAWEAFTIQHQPCSELDLMERAAKELFGWIDQSTLQHDAFYIFCGKGNNGADGLALADLLQQTGHTTVVYILELGQTGTPLFQEKLQRLRQTSVEIHFYSETHEIKLPSSNTVLVDALFGIGLNKPLSGLAADLVLQLNKSTLPILSIDIPSGMYAEKSSHALPVIHAYKTLTFQCYKTAFLYRENWAYLGEIIILDINLDSKYLTTFNNDIQFIEKYYLNNLFKYRTRFSHKGDFGNALLVVGQYGMMGAAQLAAKACLRSGVGKLTTVVPACGYTIMQTQIPEALCITSGDSQLEPFSFPAYPMHAIGVGPGIGTSDRTMKMLEEIIQVSKAPLVLDADALNIIAHHKHLLQLLPSQTILTPHPKEFERIFGETTDEFARTALQLEMAKKYDLIIIVKGHYTKIAIPTGNLWVNKTGNPGLSKAGTGDVLTGMITAFLAQGYEPIEAAKLGVFFHGSAADHCLQHQSEESMLASDIIESIGEAFATR